MLADSVIDEFLAGAGKTWIGIEHV